VEGVERLPGCERIAGVARNPAPAAVGVLPLEHIGHQPSDVVCLAEPIVDEHVDEQSLVALARLCFSVERQAGFDCFLRGRIGVFQCVKAKDGPAGSDRIGFGCRSVLARQLAGAAECSRWFLPFAHHFRCRLEKRVYVSILDAYVTDEKLPDRRHAAAVVFPFLPAHLCSFDERGFVLVDLVRL